MPGTQPQPATGSIAPPADHASIGLDFDLQHFTVFGAGQDAQLQAAPRTLRRVELDHLDALRQVCQHRATMTRRAALMPSWDRRTQPTRLLLAAALAALALAAEHALLKISDLCLRNPQLCAQHRLALRGLLLELAQYPPVALIAPARAFNRSLMQALPAAGLHDQPDMLLLGQRHIGGGERYRLCIARRRWARFHNARRHRHGQNRSGKRQLCPAGLALPDERVHRMFTNGPPPPCRVRLPSPA